MPHVVEGEHGVEQHEARFILDLDRRLQCHRLEPRSGVVAEISDRASGESRQAGHKGRMIAGHQLAERLHERLVGFGCLAGTIDNRLATA